MRWATKVIRWGRAANDAAVANAREATTELSRLRVEREEVELYLRTRYGVGAIADARPAAGDR